jgi:hypothetical protein
MRWAGHVTCMRMMRNSYKVLIRKPEGKRPLGRNRHRWENNIKLDLKEIRCDGIDWNHLARDRDQWWAHVNTIMNLQIS